MDLPVRPAICKQGRSGFVHQPAFQLGGFPAGARCPGSETYSITPVGAASSNAQGEGANHAATTANRLENSSLLLSYEVQKSLVQNLGATDRGARRARFAVLASATMPAILIEGGYMSHPVEGKKIFSAAYRRQMAQAMVKGILDYQRLTSPPSPVASSRRRRTREGLRFQDARGESASLPSANDFVRRKIASGRRFVRLCGQFPFPCADFPIRAGVFRFVRPFFNPCGRSLVSCGPTPRPCGNFPIRADVFRSVRAKMPRFDGFWRI